MDIKLHFKDNRREKAGWIYLFQKMENWLAVVNTTLEFVVMKVWVITSLTENQQRNHFILQLTSLSIETFRTAKNSAALATIPFHPQLGSNHFISM